MINCACCGTNTTFKVKTIDFGTGLLMLCEPCYLTCKDLMRMRNLTFGQAYQELRDTLNATVAFPQVVYNEPEEDETLDTIIVNREPILCEDYSALEYDCLSVYVPNPFFSNRQDQINWLNELMEIALLGGDVRWANDLYKQIKSVKERANNDTV